jgi:hypothetical protein
MGLMIFLGRQKYTAEPLVPEPSVSEIKSAIEKLKTPKSPGIDQIPAELFKAGCRKIRCEIHKPNISIWNKEELPEELFFIEHAPLPLVILHATIL